MQIKSLLTTKRLAKKIKNNLCMIIKKLLIIWRPGFYSGYNEEPAKYAPKRISYYQFIHSFRRGGGVYSAFLIKYGGWIHLILSRGLDTPLVVHPN